MKRDTSGGRHVPAVLFILCVLCFGCGRRGGGSQGSADAQADDPRKFPPGVISAPDRDADSPDRVDRTPRVSDDAAGIAEVRRLFDREIEELTRAGLDRVRAGDFPYTEHQMAFARSKPRAVDALKRLLAGDDGATERGRARAAAVLIRLGEADGERFLFDSLRSPAPELRSAALEILDDWGVEVAFDGPGRAQAILTLVDDPDPSVSRAACRLAASKKIPGAEAKLVGLLRKGGAKDNRDIALDLSEVAATPDGVRAMLDALFKDRPERYTQSIGFRLERSIEGPRPELAEPVRVAFREFTLGYVEEDRYDQSVARDFAMVAEARDMPLLEDIAERAKDPVSRMYAREAIARLNPDRALDRLLDFIRPGEPHAMEIQALKKYATEKDADRILAAVVADPKDPRGSVISLEVAELLLEKLGEKGRKAIERSSGRLDPRARMYAAWKLKGLDLGKAVDDLHAAGVISIARGPLLERMRAAFERNDPGRRFDTSDPDALTGALSVAGILTAFDAETDALPCDHHHLILEFAENSNGRFTPECPVQAWHRKGDDDLDAPYTVRFVYRGRLYTFGAENRGDWYDVEAVVRALNFALETSGQEERFLTLDGGGQFALIVFADPRKFLPIAEKYALPLPDDPDDAMKKGKEFERKAIEQLKK